MESLVYIALFAPLVGSLIAAAFSTTPKQLWVGILTSTLLGVSFVASLILLIVTTGGIQFHVTLMEWISAGDLYIPFGFLVDEVSATMMVVVTLVSTCVHVYSMGYMEHDKGFNRFFSYLSAFVFSMLVLVMSDNFAGLFIGWEGVGLCSWLLVGFWYHKKDVTRDVNPSISPSWAANEAFIVNRIADLGMLIGLFLIYWFTGSLQYEQVFAAISSVEIEVVWWIGLFLFIGAMGKSAQFPLHTWLADAMEGPTPVSALIHAATMVTAGVYLVIRAFPIYDVIPDIGYTIACVGAFVAMFAATMALVNRDLKRIIAYSTLSQLGYMFVAAGLGAYWIALFHLAAHAFFKALLFLGAGNVMHAMHDELDIKKMGALYKVMKPTAIFMILASVALAGIWPLAGFFSKDKILEVAFNEDAFVLWTVLWITAGLTAFYSFRLIMYVFFGKDNHSSWGAHPHEMPKFVLWSMAPLAVLAVVFGWFAGGFEKFVSQKLPEYFFTDGTHSMVPLLIVLTLAVAIGGILVAVLKYRGEGPKKPTNTEGFFYKLLINQYYIPVLYERFITKPYAKMSDVAWSIDMKVVDATVDTIANTIYGSGETARGLQTGNLSKMLRLMAAGVAALLVAAVVYGTLG